jgi:hypothetical protein
MPSRAFRAAGLVILLGAIVAVRSGDAAEPARRDRPADAPAAAAPAPSHAAQRPQAPILLSVEVIPDPPPAPAVGDPAPRDRVDRTANGPADPDAR